jgi:hypothetical protein
MRVLRILRVLKTCLHVAFFLETETIIK